VAEALQRPPDNAVHVREYALQSASDREILDHPDAEDRIVVSADTDFGTLLAPELTRHPSFSSDTAPSAGRKRQAESLLANVDAVAADLEAGSGVVVEPVRIRVRSLPIVP
jgi:predicted nuclease of predicted toxin-antitoxin system